jgi:hypothetical protein
MHYREEREGHEEMSYCRDWLVLCFENCPVEDFDIVSEFEIRASSLSLFEASVALRKNFESWLTIQLRIMAKNTLFVKR